MPSDFWVWTFVYDVSGLARVELKYRIDADGVNSTASDQNETYAGGPEVGPWQTIPMTRRIFPKGNYLGDPSVDFFVLPTYIADEYYTYVTGLSNVLVDYYVEAEDSLGNVERSPIQHVWVGAAQAPQRHTIDGALDSTAVEVASGDGLHLYADWDGEYLYVAAEGVGATSGWDHFVIVGTDLSTPVPAPWAKGGNVADRTLYLGNENENNWCGWFDDAEQVLTTDVSCAAGSYLEGLIRLESYLGTPLPSEVYLALAAYQSPDGGTLAAQAPAGNGNGDVEASEFVPFALVPSDARRALPPGLRLVASPNPFAGQVTLRFVLEKASSVDCAVYDVQGRKVRSLASTRFGRGPHALIWDGRGDRGESLASGIYFLRLRTTEGTATRKIVLIK